MDAWNTRFIEMCQEKHARHMTERKAKLQYKSIRETLLIAVEDLAYGIVLAGIMYTLFHFIPY